MCSVSYTTLPSPTTIPSTPARTSRGTGPIVARCFGLALPLALLLPDVAPPAAAADDDLLLPLPPGIHLLWFCG